ncbi:UBX domain-containing protein 1-B-like [Limulus polyphemus]|uniref:UBX domain-containing protein 1-B-like n=1 Tax=Limulus polyphemus TaxID=6850 RepID=A0ABM1BU46_LIMPO|nr:UBX domain-containing protein 1-B-like [Limulus polyphemus]
MDQDDSKNQKVQVVGQGDNRSLSLLDQNKISDAEQELANLDTEETKIDNEKGEESNEVEQPKSLQCDECGKKFKSETEVEFHAVKSGHQSFSESTEEIQPLTEDDKREQLRKLEERIKQRRLEREELEKKSAIEREKQRRKTGQELTLAKQKMEEEEIKRLAEQKRKEKLEEKMARQRVLEEIERDKQARKEKFNIGPPAVAAPSPPSQPVQEVSIPKGVRYSQHRLQIRLTNGQTLTNSFGASEALAAVRLYIELNRTDGGLPFSLMTTFPRKVFTEEDMQKPLKALGLVPSAVLTVTKPQ